MSLVAARAGTTLAGIRITGVPEEPRAPPATRSGDLSRLGAAQPDVVLQEHSAASPGQRHLLRLVEAGPVHGDHHPAPEPQDAPQIPPSGRASRTGGKQPGSSR